MLNSKPPELNSKPADTLGQPQDTKPKKDEKGLVDSDCISDQYSDDFDDELGKQKPPGKKEESKVDHAKTNSIKSFTDDEEDDDNWDMDDDDLDNMKKKDELSKKDDDLKKGAAKTNEIADKKRKDLLQIGVDNGDDIDLDAIDIDKLDFADKNEDKFNQVMSTSKENGGLLASIGLKKGENDDSIGDESQDQDPHKKSDLFDTSKDRGDKKDPKKGGEGMQSDIDEFDLDFASSKKAGDDEGTKGRVVDPNDIRLDGDEMSDVEDAENAKAINEQFDYIYKKDPELQKALEKSDVTTFTTFEKFQILEAYNQGGGASALQIELADDDEDDSMMLNDMSDEDKKHIEEQFEKLYGQDPVLQDDLGPVENLNLQQKYAILLQYHRAGEQQALHGTSQGGYGSEPEEVLEIEGKRYRRVQIEDKDEEYLMDEEGTIYDMQL